MQKQIKIWWGRQDLPTENYELTVGLNNDPNSNYYSVSLTEIEDKAYTEAYNKGFPRGNWDFNNIYDEIDANTNIYKENEQIYIRKGFDEEQGNQHNPNVLFAFGNTRLEYFIPGSNNNDSSSSDPEMEDGFVVGGGKRKRSRHSFVGKRVPPLPTTSQQSEFYKKTKSKIKNATANFLAEEKIRQNASLSYTPSEENLILEATKIKKGGKKSGSKKRKTKKRKRKRKRKTRRKRKTKKRKSTKRTRRRRRC